MDKPKICVVGSSNYDLIAYTENFPKPGETIFGTDFKMGFGGKGANQAIAAAKLGAEVTMITKLGDDLFGKQTLENYQNSNISTKFIHITKDAPSGVAPIWVDKSGMNSIIVIPGANNLMQIEEIEAAKSEIHSSKILICQNEIPFDVTQRALELAHSLGVTTIFNPAPAPKHELNTNFLKFVDILCPNETEAEFLTNIPVNNVEDALKAGHILREKGANSVLITLGAKGCVLITENEEKHIPTSSVNSIDSSGAGDCFIGSLAYFYGSGFSLEESIAKAHYVAGLSVQKHGTQTSYPDRTELSQDLFLRNVKE